MIGKIWWRSLSSSQVRHGFVREPGAFTPARCGSSPVWFDPNGWSDQDVSGKCVCARCARLLFADRGPMLDFPTAWRIARRGVVHRSHKCSYVQHWGGFLCDCGAVEAEWKRMIVAALGVGP